MINISYSSKERANFSENKWYVCITKFIKIKSR